MITNPFVADQTDYQQVELVLSSPAPKDVSYDKGFTGLSRVKVTIDDNVINPENISKGYSILGIDGSHDASANKLFIFEDPDIIVSKGDYFEFEGDDILEYLDHTNPGADTPGGPKREIVLDPYFEKLLVLGANPPDPNILPYRYQDKLTKLYVEVADYITPDQIREGVTILGIKGSAPNYLELKFSEDDESVLEISGTDVKFIDDILVLDYDSN